MFKKVRRYFRELTHPYVGEIWCLHRVLDAKSSFESNRELEISPSYLESLIIDNQSKGYTFVSIDEILNQKRHLLNQKKINVSFDDGFSDIYFNAYPLFKKYHIPFTIYLTTDFPDMKADIWWIQLERFDNRGQLIKAIYDSGKNMRDVMHELTRTTADYSICANNALTWDQIQEMVDSGLCEIGSHTVSHPGLTRIPIEEVRKELKESKNIIESHIGKPVKHFSYPHSMQNEAIMKEVRNCGYESAEIGWGGKIRKGDFLYNLNRNYIIQ